MSLDSPYWSWFHGCRKHRGQPAPCVECVRLRDHDVTRDGNKMFAEPAKESVADDKELYPGYNAAWQDYLDYMNGVNH